MFPVLEAVAAGQLPSEAVTAELLASPGMQVWLRHANKHGGLTPEMYRSVIAQATEAAAPVGKHLVDHLWKNARRRDECKKILTQFTKVNFCQICLEAAEEASRHLITPFNGPVEIYLMCATRGSAIVLDKAIVIDIADYKDGEPLPIKSIASMLAHEIFHIGRGQYIESLNLSIEKSMANPVFLLPGFMLEEGAATFLFSEDFIKEDVHVGSMYKDSLERLPEIAAWVNKILSDPGKEIDGDKLGKFLNVEGYALGTEIFKAIDKFLGYEALTACLRDPAILLEQANRAIEAGWTTIPPFSAEAVDIVKQQWS